MGPQAAVHRLRASMAWALLVVLASARFVFGSGAELPRDAVPQGVGVIPHAQLSATDAKAFLALAKSDLPALSERLSAAGAPHPDAALDIKSNMTALSQGNERLQFLIFRADAGVCTAAFRSRPFRVSMCFACA